MFVQLFMFTLLLIRALAGIYDDNARMGKTDGDMLTTTPATCVMTTGVVEFDLPGCGCCGGCGCDETCSACEGNIRRRPDYTANDDINCTLAEDCCPSKVRVTTYFVPAGCPLEYRPSLDTVVVKNKGWEVRDIDAKAEVYQDRDNAWQVMLVPNANDNSM